jgi:hypothetical protein
VSEGVITTQTQSAINSETGFDCSQGFETLQRIASMFAKSTLVPKEFQNSIPNCAIGLHMALRMRADPLMVMQNLYIVHGRPGWSSQFLIATFNQCGKFSALRYEWSGTPGTEDYGCTAMAVEKASGETLRGATITLGMARKEGWSTKNGSKWVTMPQQMLMYRAASFFVRAYAPELAMGLPTADEVQEFEETRISSVVDASGYENTQAERLAAAMAKSRADLQPQKEPAQQTEAASKATPLSAEKPASKPVQQAPAKAERVVVPALEDVAQAMNQRRLNQIDDEVRAALDAAVITNEQAIALNDAIAAKQNELAMKGTK